MCEAFRMSEQPAFPADVPKWDVADRMRKSLRHSQTGVQEMANYLEVDRSTVSTWINGRIEPSTQSLRLWALRTGVPYEWLRYGASPQPGTGVFSPRTSPLHLIGGISRLLAAA
jgi:transcriptional regulator with XRE-family HTH domain